MFGVMRTGAILNTGDSRVIDRAIEVPRPMEHSTHTSGPVAFIADIEVPIKSSRPPPVRNGTAGVISEIPEENRGSLSHAWLRDRRSDAPSGIRNERHLPVQTWFRRNPRGRGERDVRKRPRPPLLRRPHR